MNPNIQRAFDAKTAHAAITMEMWFAPDARPGISPTCNGGRTSGITLVPTAKIIGACQVTTNFL